MSSLATSCDSTIDDKAKARLIAYYLPQFHPVPENDHWWGKGFTEWTNVAKARPLFRGHLQPRLPADLGFYDLRVPETREAQADMARSCGVEGFCYWHYWFGGGRRILERPFSEIVSSGKPDYPFCLAWANQSWTGIWHGQSNKTLIAQSYPGKADEKAHFMSLLPAFEDQRYLRVDGKPLFSVYMPLDLPDPFAFVEHWRELAVRAGLKGLFLVAMWNDPFDKRLDGFDAVTPNGPSDFFGSNRSIGARLRGRFNRSKMGRVWAASYSNHLSLPNRRSYDALVHHGLMKGRFTPRMIPCVVPNWDNSPRSGRRAVVVQGSTPSKFERYLGLVVNNIHERTRNQRIIFLKAWNEWAEGNFVEPDQDFGTSYLDAIRNAIL